MSINEKLGNDELILFVDKPLIEIYTEKGLEIIKSEVDRRIVNAPTDISTEKGRAAIRSYAAQIAKLKNAFDKTRVSLVKDKKAELKVIDGYGGNIWDFLEGVQKQVRKPLDDFEAAEERRVQERENRLAKIDDYNQHASDNIEQLEKQVVEVDALIVFDWQEFTMRADEYKDKTLNFLKSKLAKAKQDKADKEELERLRKEKEERDRIQREEQIAKDAADKATKAAEDKSGKEKQDIIDKAEKDKNEAVKQAVEQAFSAPAAPIYDNTTPSSLKTTHVSVVKDTSQGYISKAPVTEPNIDNITKHQNQAIADFIRCGLSKYAAKLAVDVIDKGLISNIEINY